MTKPTTHCDPLLLERLIHQSLVGEELVALEVHLSECETCRLGLQKLVGPTHFWDVASSRLRNTQNLLSNGTVETNESTPPLTFLRALLSPTDNPDSMGRLGLYEIIGVIGFGGMGIVVKGHDTTLNRYVAIKLLAPQLANSGAARQRFSREAKAAAAVIHENVLAIHAIDQWQGVPYLVMPYIPGCSLAKRIADEGMLPLNDILRIAQQISAGLAEAHAQGLVHRDIKPANILLGKGSERLKISDFGLARAADDASLTRSGTISGTPLYMSPEQARGEPVDTRSDIFSFGSLLYEACTGHPPFQAETPFGILRRIQEDAPRHIHQFNPSIPEWLCRLIAIMLSKSPDERTYDANQLAELFRCGLTHQLQPAGSKLPALLQSLQPRSNRTLWMAGAVATMAVLLTLWMTWPVGNANLLKIRTPENPLPRTTSNSPRVASPVVLANEPANKLDRSVSTQPKRHLPIRYQFQPGDVFFLSGSLTIEREEGELNSPMCVAITVLNHAEDDTFELKYQFWARPQVQYHSMGAMNPFAPGGIETESSLLNRTAHSGRIKINGAGQVLGRSQTSELPGQLGPIADLLFPSLTGMLQDEPSSLEFRQIELNRILVPPQVGPTFGAFESLTFKRSTTKQLEGSSSEEGQFVRLLTSDELQTPPEDLIAEKTGIAPATTRWEYGFQPNGYFKTIHVERNLSDLDEQQRLTHSGCKLTLNAIDEATFEQVRKRLHNE